MLAYVGYKERSGITYYVYAANEDGNGIREIAQITDTFAVRLSVDNNNTICWITRGKQRYTIIYLKQVQYFIL